MKVEIMIILAVVVLGITSAYFFSKQDKTA